MSELLDEKAETSNIITQLLSESGIDFAQAGVFDFCSEFLLCLIIFSSFQFYLSSHKSIFSSSIDICISYFSSS